MSTLRPIERGDFPDIARPDDLGPAPQLQWIAIDRLGVDDSYQRPIESHTSKKKIRAIATRFDWRGFAPVIVSPVEGGRYAVVDGQHRVTAALLIGIDQVPCQIILADRREQARAFEAINANVTLIKPSQVFKARLLAGDADAKRIAAVAAAADVRILYSNRAAGQTRPGETTALSAISRAVEAYGEKAARLALTAIRRNAGERPGYLRGPSITALATVLGDNIEWRDAPELLDIFAPPFDFAQQLRESTARAAGLTGITATDQMQAALTRHLNAWFEGERA